MTATILGERWDSRKQTSAWKDSNATLTYIITGTESDSAILAKAYSACPSTSAYESLPFVKIDLEHFGGGVWKADVRYGQGTPPVTVFNFDTGGGTSKITQSIATTNSYAAGGGTAPDHKGAIGVTRDSVEGCEITTAVFNWSETHYLPVSTVTSAYIQAVYEATGCMNDSTWRGYDANEVLFLGASGSQRGWQDWEITFKFASNPHETDISIGDIDGIDKDGWDWLWVSYQDGVDYSASSPAMVKTPTAVYCEQVYKLIDMTTLGLGS